MIGTPYTNKDIAYKYVRHLVGRNEHAHTARRRIGFYSLHKERYPVSLVATHNDLGFGMGALEPKKTRQASQKKKD